MERSIDPAVSKVLDFANWASLKLGYANGEPSYGESRRDRDRERFAVAERLEPEWVPLCSAAAASCPPAAQQVIALRKAIANATHDRREHAQLAAAFEALEVAAYQASGSSGDAEFVGPLMPSEWCKRLGGISLSTFGRWRKNGDLRCRSEGTKRIWIHAEDVNRYKKK